MNNVVVTKVFEEGYIFYMLRFKYKAQFKLGLLPQVCALRCERLPACLSRGGGGKRREADGVGGRRRAQTDQRTNGELPLKSAGSCLRLFIPKKWQPLAG